MPKKRKPLDRFAGLTWNDLEEWAGSKVVSRGKSYHEQGRVSGLAITEDGGLLAWVDGSERYATRVDMDEGGLPDSVCSCPYQIACKHGVAVALEFMERLENNRRVPKAGKDDERLAYFNDDAGDDEPALPEAVTMEIDTFLKNKTKTQLIDLIHGLAERHPEMRQDIVDRKLLATGDAKELIVRLRREIRETGEEPGWQDYWRAEGYTPNYSGIRNKLETLLKSGHADDVLALGEELIAIGARQVEESDDEGETATEIAACMPVLVKALEQSSLASADRLAWAVDAVLKDQFEICGAMYEYLRGRHKKRDWSLLADRLLDRLKKFKTFNGGRSFGRDYERDRLSGWVVHAMDRAGRDKEIIPLLKAEAKKTASYDRLVQRLIGERDYEDAERWIKKGIRDLGGKWPGIASSLRDKLQEIRVRQKDWPAVAAMHVEEFVRSPSRKAFMDCKLAAGKVKAWPRVREYILDYLENGILPWKREDWPLPESGLDAPEIERNDRFPMVDDLIDIAILEKKPDQVLRWYDRLPSKRLGWYGVNEDEIATAVQTHAPERAVVVWKKMAERLIDTVKPSAYQEAARYLRKAGQVMTKGKKQNEWGQYLRGLKEKHTRKRRLVEILDGIEAKPTVKKKR